jgi:predicted DNA-binding antitoxin AbrB/MazE fold protein
MTKEVRGRFSRGAIELLEEIELEEGEEVTLIVKRKIHKKGACEALMAAAGGWKGTHDPEELKRIIYESRIRGSRTPPDL